MKWFFGCSGNAAEWFKEMARVSAISALRNTDLEPHFLYDGEPSDLTCWMESSGVTVHFTQVPFRDELYSDRVLNANAGNGYRPDNATGHFLRLLVTDFADSGVALYTDCDVMFATTPKLPAIKTIAAVPELDFRTWTATSIGSFNSGVMAINVPYFRSVRDELIEFIRERNFFYGPQSSYDQVLLNQYFAGNWTALPPELNWRPVSGINKAAQIIHFHGPKPHRVKALLDGEAIKGEDGLIAMIQHERHAYDRYIGEFYECLNAGPPSRASRLLLHWLRKFGMVG